MSEAIILSGFVLGLAGSLHCLGMCGPLAWALPIRHATKSRQVSWLIIYQLGRITTYGLLGSIAGSIGNLMTVSGYQQFLSISLGGLILFFGVAALSPQWAMTWGPVRRYQMALSQTVEKIWKRPINSRRMFLLGSLNGWLPCGMTYLAMLSAMTMNRAGEGWLLLTAFGTGTIPAMMLMSLGGLWVGKEIRKRMSRMVPIAVGVVGLVLIVRGLNLGIPFLSPASPDNGAGDAIQCATTLHR